MKCPECSYNQSYSDGMTCKNCQYVFVFDPKKDKLADGKFIAAINAASANDTYFYTRNQLYTQLVRKTADSVMPLWIIVGICASVAVVGFIVGLPTPILGIALFIMGICMLLAIFSKPAVADRHTVDEFIERYQRLGKPERLSKLIEKPALHDPPPEWQEPDIYDYGFERLLIVDDDLLVDLLVKNNFHANERALILSETLYPEYIVPHAAKALVDNPQLPVFFLHASTQEGMNLQQRMLSSQRLPLQDHPMIDLGLQPEDVKQMKNLRPLNLNQRDHAIPADLLMFGTLSVGIGSAMASQVPLGQLINQPSSSDAFVADFG